MGRIQTSIGLITGTDITGTVDQLIAISGIPRDRLVARNDTLGQEQEAISQLTASVIAVQLSGDRLAESSLFQTRKDSSSNEDALSVSSSSGAPLGEYTVTTQQLAATHSVGSRQRFGSTDTALGLEGQIDIRNGGFLEHSLSLQDLNGGLGVQKGSIRITDRSGASAEIDLSAARTIDDVLDTINANTTINVQASADRDGITLTDKSGETTANLRVDEVGDGETAADLGLYGLNVAGDVAVGGDLTQADALAFQSTTLSDLGVSLEEGDDLRIEFADGSSLDLDLNPADDEDGTAPQSVGELLDFLNEAADGKLSASISASGDSLLLQDLTAGAEAFTISDQNGSQLASALGFEGTGSGGQIESPSRSPYLHGVALSQLGGGQGLGDLTELDITLRDGSSATVDVSGADTIQQVVDAINDSGLSLVAKLDDAKTGLRIRDLSGGAAENFTISSSDDTATRLGIATDSTSTILDGKHLGRQYVDETTLLSDLNQGFGITPGSFKLTDSAGLASAINLKTQDIETVGELIDEINDLGIGVTASINPNGDGIALVDTAGGEGTLTVENTDTAVAATELGLAGTATTQTINGEEVEAIVGGDSLSIEVEADDTLQSIVDKINASERYVKASIATQEDGSYSLRLTSRQGGSQGQFSIDTSGFDLAIETSSRGQDAEILLTSEDGSARKLTSIDGVFEDETSGLSMTLKQLSDDPISVSVAENPKAVVDAAKTLVTQYNLLMEKLDSLTFYEAETETYGLLFGSTEALRIETGYSRLLSGAIRGSGDIASLGEVGLRLNDTGQMELDEEKLTAKLESDGASVEEFFTTEDTGVAARLSALAERLVGTENGMLLTRGNALTAQVESNNERIDTLNTRLDNERERLLTQFYNMEAAISKLQSNQQYVSAIQPITYSSS
ncbi:flagellar filament capping protein FliD [Roseimaritima ulvae]|uniref:Filament cap protein n=1 Tax=Roseimaritima ulvae TaxID=980254 RepID=A0A5B9R0B9_9BACT|nr:flagellar filament capping protein FliD [Roseimaritima ulvae]QEG39711.1 Flagellar hook-associated protein 2 [Roseimaritima ulvae]